MQTATPLLFPLVSTPLTSSLPLPRPEDPGWFTGAGGAFSPCDSWGAGKTLCPHSHAGAVEPGLGSHRDGLRGGSRQWSSPGESRQCWDCLQLSTRNPLSPIPRCPQPALLPHQGHNSPPPQRETESVPSASAAVGRAGPAAPRGDGDGLWGGGCSVPQPAAEVAGKHFASQPHWFSSLCPRHWWDVLVGALHPPEAEDTLLTLLPGLAQCWQTSFSASRVREHQRRPHQRGSAAPLWWGSSIPPSTAPSQDGSRSWQRSREGTAATYGLGGVLLDGRLVARQQCPPHPHSCITDAFRPDLHGRSHGNSCVAAGCWGGGAAQ